jgi:2-hydroxychromene-2-carboxylate isomerase
MLHIDIWADFGCPACYLAKPRIDQAIAASGHSDAIKPYAIHHPVASSGNGVEDVRRPAQDPGRASDCARPEVQVRESVGQGPEADFALHPGQRGAEAEVATERSPNGSRRRSGEPRCAIHREA